jgi:hypothetical protein
MIYMILLKIYSFFSVFVIGKIGGRFMFYLIRHFQPQEQRKSINPDFEIRQRKRMNTNIDFQTYVYCLCRTNGLLSWCSADSLDLYARSMNFESQLS